MSDHLNPDRIAEAIAKTRLVFDNVDDDPQFALFLTDGVRRQVAQESGGPVKEVTALVGIHLARVEVGRDPRRAAVYQITPKQVERSLAFIKASGVKTRLGDIP